MKRSAFISRQASSLSVIMLVLAFSLSATGIYASDLSDAETLRDKCDREIAELQVPAKNFGDQADLGRLDEGAGLIKLGKVKLLQSKYLEASASFNKYLALQQGLYKSLAEKYMARTEKMADDIAVELVDSKDPKVAEYLKLANQNLKDAKGEMLSERYKNAIKLCRVSKNYSLAAFKAAGKPVPEEYRKDSTDNENRIAQ